MAAGESLVIGPATVGLRTYVAVRGGVDVPPELGSRSTDVLSGLGPAPLTAGTYRLQARRDPFSSNTAGVALAHVLEDGETPADAQRSLAARVLALEPADAFARARMAGANLPVDAAGFGYLAAALESGVVAQPLARSGYAASLARLSQTQAKLRWVSIIALILGGLALALAVGRSGLHASARADQILSDAGHEAAVLRRAHLRAVGTVALSVLSLVLVFVVVGLYVLARSAP